MNQFFWSREKLALSVFSGLIMLLLSACNSTTSDITVPSSNWLQRTIDECGLPPSSPVRAYLVANETRLEMNSDTGSESATITQTLTVGSVVTVEIVATVSGQESVLATASRTVDATGVLSFVDTDFTFADDNNDGVSNCSELIIAADGSLTLPVSPPPGTPVFSNFQVAVHVDSSVYGSPAISSGLILTAASGPSGPPVLSAFDQSLERLWRADETEAGSIGTHQEAAVDQNGNAFVLRLNNSNQEEVELKAFSPNGTPTILSYRGGGGQFRSGASIDSVGRVVFTHSPDEIAIRALDGTVNTINKEGLLGLAIHSKPAISNSGVAYFTRASSAGLVGVNLATEKVFKDCAATTSQSSPAIDSSGNVIFGADNGRVYSCSPEAVRNWSWALPSSESVKAIRANPLIDENDNIYIHANNGVVYKFNSEGTLLKQYDSGIARAGSSFFKGTPLLTDNGQLIIVNEAGITILRQDDLSLVAVRDSVEPAFASAGSSTPTLLDLGEQHMLVFRAGTRIVGINVTNTGGLSTTAAWPKWGADLRNSGRQR